MPLDVVGSSARGRVATPAGLKHTARRRAHMSAPAIANRPAYKRPQPPADPPAPRLDTRRAEPVERIAMRVDELLGEAGVVVAA